MGSPWGGTDVWVRGQGESFAKAIWYFQRWMRGSVLSIKWTGMTEAEKEEAQVWCAQFEEKSRLMSLESKQLQSNEEYRQAVEPDFGRKWMECRAGCGEKNSTLACSKCKLTRESQRIVLGRWSSHLVI
jgi:hypothetical protein